MPGDIAIHAASLTSGVPSSAQAPADPGSAAAIQARAAPPVAVSTTSASSTGARSVTTAAASTSVSPQSLHTNPVSQLDPALGIVVLGFYNNQGVETSSIPTQKQLNSYRLHGDGPESTSQLKHPVTSET